jgi:hypothetical protein
VGVSDNVALIAPAYSTDPRLTSLIVIATSQLSRCRFGQQFEYAVALLVCHMIARNPSTQPGAPGAVTSATEGGVSQSYTIPPDLQKRYSDWTSTSYGCQLAQLAEGSIVAPMAVGGSGLGPEFQPDFQGEQF